MIEELRNLLDRLRSFITNLNHQSKSNTKQELAPIFEKVLRGQVILSDPQLGGVFLPEAEKSEYQDLVGAVCLSVARKFGHGKDLDGLHISKGAIESAIQLAILRALDIPNQSNETFAERLSTCLAELQTTLLKEPESWLVQMEVRGLSSDGMPCRFGEIEFKVLREKKENASDADKGSPASSREGGLESLLVPTEGAIYAEILIEATDHEAAKTLAERKLRLTVDALNFFGDFFDVMEARVTLPGDAAVSDVKTYVYSRTSPKKKHVSVGTTKPFLRFSFASISPSEAKNSGFERISSILANPSPSPLDEKIMASIQWAGRASIESRREEAFLLFCISLEALLLGNRSTEITQTFALRGAHLLIKDAAKRKETFKDLKSLYGIRSNIVHSGHTRVAQADLLKIRWLAKTAVLIMLVHEPLCRMKIEQEVDDWFETQLLAGISPTTEPPEYVQGS